MAAAVEQWGRVGAEAEELLRVLVREANNRERQRTGGCEGGRMRRSKRMMDEEDEQEENIRKSRLSTRSRMEKDDGGVG